MSNKIKIYYNKIYASRFAPLVLITLFYLPVYIFSSGYSGDDVAMFRNAWKNSSVITYFQMRYMTWSSRNILEFFSVFVCTYVDFTLFKFINLLMYMIIWASVSYVFFNKDKKYSWMLVFGLQFIPLRSLMETGIATIATTYIWSFAAGSVSFITLKEIILKEHRRKIHWYELILSYVLFSIMCNMELYLLILFILLAICIMIIFVSSVSKEYTEAGIHISRYIRSIKLDIRMIGYFIIMAAELICFLLCPGNRHRANTYESETIHASLPEKAMQGFLSAMQYMIENYGFQLFFITFLIIYICVFYSVSSKIEKILLAALTVSSFCMSYILFALFFMGLLPKKLKFIFNYLPFRYSGISISLYAAEIILYLMIAVLLIYFPLKHRSDIYLKSINSSVLIVSFIVTAILSRSSLGFSPTLDIDLDRQSLPCIFFIILTMLYLMKFYKNKYIYTEALFVTMSVISFVRNAFFAFYYLI